MKELEFDIQVTKKELFHFLMHHFYTSFSGIFGLILSLGAFVIFFMSLGKREPFQLVILFIMGCLFTFIQPLQMQMKAGQQMNRNPVFKEPIHYHIDKKGITVSQNGDAGTIEWEAVRKVVETKRAFYVYMTVMNANIIPKDQIFELAGAFKNELKEKIGKNKCKLMK